MPPWSSACEKRRQTSRRVGVPAPGDDEPPHLAVLRHVEVAVAVALALVELLVDERGDGDTRLGVLRRDRVAEGPHRLALTLVEETEGRRVVHAFEDDLARDLVP